MTAVHQIHAGKDKVENIHTALCAAQSEIENPPKEKEAKLGKYSYKYADISDVLKCVLPVLSKNGITVTQSTRIEDGSMILKTILTHGVTDTKVECDYPVCSLNGDHQKMGGALTYARRYALCTMVGVAPADDLDGVEAAKSGDGDRQQMSVDQAKREINWSEIEDQIRKANSHERLNKIADRVTANKGYWPNSYVSSAFEEIKKRRDEIDYRTHVESEGLEGLQTLLADCHTVSDVNALRAVFIDLGKDIDDVDDQFTTRIMELSE